MKKIIVRSQLKSASCGCQLRSELATTTRVDMNVVMFMEILHGSGISLEGKLCKWFYLLSCVCCIVLNIPLTQHDPLKS